MQEDEARGSCENFRATYGCSWAWDIRTRRGSGSIFSASLSSNSVFQQKIQTNTNRTEKINTVKHTRMTNQIIKASNETNQVHPSLAVPRVCEVEAMFVVCRTIWAIAES
jgi:hypothetical protein